MRSIFFLMLLWLLISCGTSTQKSNTVVIGKDTTTVVVETPPKEVIIEPIIPADAVIANYRKNTRAFYGYVKDVHMPGALTTIAFEDNAAPELLLGNSLGAEISYLRFPQFESDLLLVNTVIKDPNFNKYYLFVLRDNKWKQVVNGWAIHKDNRPDTLQPITIDEDDPDMMFRYYSVFDLDKNSELGYTWRLLNERIPIEYR
ncbi:MAG: hypothetical protein DWP94_07945 [Flavobacterium sp.]|nr:MAG: hypothetical protein DWP94_07945 [Flavobacterium sp.]